MMWGAADGTMGPPFVIVKCAAKGPDFGGTRVLKTLSQKHGFTDRDGWELRCWSRNITLVSRGRERSVDCKRPYLLHHKGCVITAHPTAWMDSAGMAMWADVQMGPWAASTGRRKLIVWDNCSSHGVPAVRAAFAEHNIQIEALPPHMTSTLQVMDLVVNGPLKAALRGARAEAMLAYFQEWKLQCATAQSKEQPGFSPPKPTLANGLRALTRACNSTFTTESFKGSLRRTFVRVGLAADAEGRFIKYTEAAHGVLQDTIKPADLPDESGFFLGDVVAEVEMEARPRNETEVRDDIEPDLSAE
jgi:hypothetical protein